VLFVWLTIADISHHCEDHPYAVFGLGWCAYSIPYALTVVVAPLYPFACDETLLSFTLLLVMAITASFCLESRDRDTALIFADLRNDESAPEEYSNLDERCLVLGKKKGLTPREIEVMQLLCRGNSKSYIAEKLYVTENTVKGHTKHIYQKLDVHSKSELQALVGL
jgi:DNA-binding CsgD family transcriptional regulator